MLSIKDLHTVIRFCFDKGCFLPILVGMSLLNQKHTKEFILEMAEVYSPEKTRVSKEFLTQVENVLSCVLVKMVANQYNQGMTLKESEWGNEVINTAKNSFTKLEPKDYLRCV